VFLFFEQLNSNLVGFFSDYSPRVSFLSGLGGLSLNLCLVCCLEFKDELFIL